MENKSPHLFVIDDSKENCEILKEIFTDIDYKVTTAFHGGEALELIKNTPFDLILLDIMMPGISGIQLCREISQMIKDGAIPDTPVIFLTACVEKERIVEGFEAGAVDYIIKPFHLNELLARVHTHLDIKFSKERLAGENKSSDQDIDDSLEYRFQLLFKNLPASSFFLEEQRDDSNKLNDLNIIEFNGYFIQNLGNTAEQIIGNSLFSAFNGYTILEKTLKKHLDDNVGPKKTLKTEIYEKEKRQWLRLTGYRSENDFYMLLVEDVTVQKLAQEEKFQLTQEFEKTVKGLENMVFRFRRDSNNIYRLVLCEGKVADNYGISTIKSYGKSIEEFFGHETYLRIAPNFQKAFNGEQHVSFDFEFRGQWFLTSLSVFEMDKNNQVIEVIGSLENMTNLKKAENDLKMREKYLDAIVYIQWYLMIFEGDENYYQRILKILCEVSGADRIFIYNKYTTPNDHTYFKHITEWDNARKSFSDYIPELQKIPIDGDYARWFQMLSKEVYISSTIEDLPDKEKGFFNKEANTFLLFPIMVNGELFGVIGLENHSNSELWEQKEISLLSTAVSSLSIFEEKRIALDAKNIMLQELRSSNMMKNKLLAIIAHDLRGPLGNIKTAMEIIAEDLETPIDDIKKELITEVKKSSASTYELLEELLIWSKNQQNTINFNPQILLMREIVDDVFHLLAGTAKEKSIFLKTDIDEETPAYADMDMIKTIIRNLISNSLKFTNKYGMIKVSATISEEMVKVQISDTGVGIAEEYREKVFKSDEYITTYGTNHEKGSGLGLNLCKEFVERNGGKIWFDSEINKGTDFYFTLPLPDLDD